MIEIDANGKPIQFNDRDNYKVFVELQKMNQKMDKQIALLESIVRILESRTDDGR